MKLQPFLYVLVVSLVAAAAPARAVQPDEILPDAKMEARARALSAELRCLVCQNQSIDDSDAPLARDLRLLVRERLKTGDSDRAVRDFIVARYGNFVLLKPPFAASTLLLWLAPLMALLGAIWLGWRTFGQKPAAVPAGKSAARLDAAEEARLKSLLADDDARRSS